MVLDLRDELILKVTNTTNMCGKTRRWILANFSDDDSVSRNCQGMRNHIFSFWFKATSLLECLFGHVKKGNKAALKRGRLFEVLEDVFFFVDIRVHKIASDLRDLKAKGAFMESKPPKEHKRDPKQTRGAVGWRWQNQINCMASCTVIHQQGDFVISHETVAATGRTLEPVTVVHITSLQGFLWIDSHANVPPTCCCPENRNGKGVCCGIMSALRKQPQFSAWFQSNWFRPELLARRHRGDLDPFIDIEGRLNQQLGCTYSTSKQAQQAKPCAAKSQATPASVIAKCKEMLEHVSGLGQELVDLIDKQMDNCFHEVKCMVMDKKIIQRQLQLGKDCTPSVAYARGGKAKSGKASSEAHGNGGKYAPGNLSPIDSIAAKPDRGPSKGNSAHLPLSAKRYCIYCNDLIATASFGQHEDTATHNRNEETCKNSGQHCMYTQFDFLCAKRVFIS